MSAEHLRREIAEMMRVKSSLVSDYLDHAKKYADLVADHAEALTRELFPKVAEQDQRLLAVLQLQKENPEQLRAKLEALRKKGVKVSHVFVCRESLAVYIFGPREQ